MSCSMIFMSAACFRTTRKLLYYITRSVCAHSLGYPLRLGKSVSSYLDEQIFICQSQSADLVVQKYN